MNLNVGVTRAGDDFRGLLLLVWELFQRHLEPELGILRIVFQVSAALLLLERKGRVPV